MKKTREAVVVSDKMTKTRVVVIERVYRHPRYERVITRAKRLKAHDEANAEQGRGPRADRGDAAAVEGQAVADPRSARRRRLVGIRGRDR